MEFFQANSELPAYYIWSPVDRPKLILQISHGMTEHAGRYSEFGEFLASKGILVIAHDHPGHGQTVATKEQLGHIDDHDGWPLILQGINQIRGVVKEKYPDVPIVLLGHSMGSFAARGIMAQAESEYIGLIISGTAWFSNPKIFFGKLGTRLLCALFGSAKKMKITSKLSFKQFNKQVKERTTPFDWLTRDTVKVKEYSLDPLCAYRSSNGFFRDLLNGIELAHSKASLCLLNKNLPILIISGDKDPVGEGGKGPYRLYKMYKKEGMTNLTLKLYKGARHELLNEINRVEVMEFLYRWLNEQIINKITYTI